MTRFSLVLVLGLSLAACSKTSSTANSEGSAAPAKTNAPAAPNNLKPVPDFALARVAGGSPLKTDDLKGKVTVVDFWATWCEPCISEIPNFNKLHEKYAGKGVEVLGVTLESGSLDDIKPKVAEFKMQYPVVVGDDKTVEGFGGLLGYPTTFLVTKDGKIYKRYLGALPNKQETLQNDIDKLLASSEQ